MIRQPSRLPRRPDPITIIKFFGIDETNTRDVSRASEMVNCILDDEGTPEMRTGYTDVLDASLGAGPILGIHRWTDSLIILHHGTKLYSYDFNVAPVEIYDGLGGSTVSKSFKLQSKLVIFDGTDMLLYDGSTVTRAVSSAYIPTYLISSPAAGGGTRNEDLNLLNPRWWQTFNTVAGTYTYQLHETNLDAIEEVKLDNVTLTVTTDYTVDLDNGTVTLVNDPGTTTNGLEVQPRKDSIVDADRILNCTFAQIYGGSNDSRVFMSGNPDYPSFDWWTGIPETGNYDPTYWPDSNFDKIGGDTEAVTGYAVQYDRMIVMKEDSNYLRSWELTTDGFGRTVTRFPSVPLNDAEGCVSDESVAIIKNNPYFMSDLGMREVVGTNVRDERDVENVSSLVTIPATGRLTAIDHRDKYYLAVGDEEVWIADYERQVKDESNREYKPVWYKWEDVPVNVWYSDGTTLYFGASDRGMLCRFKNRIDDEKPYNDNGAAINTKFVTIFTDFDRVDLTKLVQSIKIQAKPWGKAKITLQCYDENGPTLDVDTETINLVDFSDWDFADVSFSTSYVRVTYAVRLIDARDIQMFRLELTSSGEPDEFFGFFAISMVYQYMKEVL